MKVLVFGGRDYQDYDTLRKILNKLHRQHNFTQVIHGAAKGADSLADRWARETGIPIRAFPANWNLHAKRCNLYCRSQRYCRSAGIRRNERMRDEGKPDLAVGFPGGNGTKHMSETARAAGITTMLVERR